MKRLMGAVVLCSVVSASGCYRVAVSTGNPPGGVVVERKAHTFVYGLIGADLAAPCPAAVVETRMGALDWLLGGLTLGLYTPRTVRVVCAAVAVPPGLAAVGGER